MGHIKDKMALERNLNFTIRQIDNIMGRKKTKKM